MANFFSDIASYGRPAEMPFLGSPLEQMGEAMKHEGMAKGKLAGEAAELGNLKWNALSVDNAERQKDYEELKALSDNITQRVQTEGLTPDTKKSIQDLRASVQQKKQPGGSIYLQEQRYNQFMDYLKELNEKKQKNQITAEDYNRLYNESQIAIQKDKTQNGLSSTLPLQTIADNKYQEAVNHAYKVANDMMITTEERFTNFAAGKYNLPAEKMIAFQQLRKQRPKEFIKEIARLELQQNREFNDYFDQTARLDVVDDYTSGQMRGLVASTRKAAEEVLAENPEIAPGTPEFQELVRNKDYELQQDLIHENFKQNLIGEIANQAGNIYQRYEQQLTPNIISSKEAEMDIENKKAKEREEWETKLTVVGPQGVSNIKNLAESEPINSVLSTIFNFGSDANKAKGLLNFASWFAPSIRESPWFKQTQENLKKTAQISEDKADEIIGTAGEQMKIEIIKDIKDFKDKFGFNNIALDQAYDIVNLLASHRNPQDNPDYDRVAKIVALSDPTFNTLSKKEQFRKVMQVVSDFPNTLKTDPIDTPVEAKTLADINKRFLSLNLSNLDSDETTRTLGTLGLSSNSTFFDVRPTGKGKPITLTDIMKRGSLEWQGENRITNSFGPGMQYFIGGDGRAYYSKGKIESQKSNYFQWNMNQLPNRLNRSHAFPLLFKNRRDQQPNEEIPANIPQAKLEQDLETGQLVLEVQFDPIDSKEKVTLGKDSDTQNTPEILTALFLKYYENKRFPDSNGVLTPEQQFILVQELKEMGF